MLCIDFDIHMCMTLAVFVRKYIYKQYLIIVDQKCLTNFSNSQSRVLGNLELFQQ